MLTALAKSIGTLLARQSRFLESFKDHARAHERVTRGLEVAKTADQHSGRSHFRTVALAGCLYCLLLGSSALANDVQPGYDLFETDPGTTFQDFQFTPIPADFFGPGSDPFVGIIALQGNPQPGTLCPGDDLSRVDTIVERLGVSSHPVIPSTDVIDIEIVALSLTSVEPITVTFNGGQNPELWDVDVELSSAIPQPQGEMIISHENPDGGVFDSALPVVPRFIFIRLGDGFIQELDFGAVAAPPILFEAQGVPWIHVNQPPESCTSNFCVNPDNLTLEQALLAQHGVISVCPGELVPPADFGDAPDPTYPTLLASNGAHHFFLPGFFLGAGVDHEPDGQPDPSATGDDLLDGMDDEDGVSFDTPLIPGQPAQVTVGASAPGLLSAWIDFDGNGSWGEPGEQIAGGLPLVPGPNLLPFGVPPGAANGPTFARFRFSSAPLPFDGPAPDGEVEDYEVSIEEAPLLDFGDAPEPPYPTFLVSNGASHIIVPGFFLGSVVDDEPDGQPDPTATGDDLADGNDDEDGVSFHTPLIPGQPVDLTVIASAPGMLSAWIDFDGNGFWGDPGEQIFAGLPLGPGSNPLGFGVPPGAAGGPTFARFRFSSAPLPFDGPAPDGEVEDYEVLIEEPPPPADFGDAPDPAYPTLLASNGAHHFFVPGFFLGAGVDHEPDGQPDPSATGDDLLDGMDDEDGVSFDTPLVPGLPAQVTVGTPAQGGMLSAWIDFDGNGSWGEPGEQIAGGLPLVPGPNPLPFVVPPGAFVGPSFARFRFSSVALPFDGPAPDGEVEDYEVRIEEPLPLDFGDAPEPPYPTLAGSNGASHIIAPGFFLGAGVDSEPDGQPDPNALGDDLLDGMDDEDGVTFDTPLVQGQPAQVTVSASAPGLLSAWIDFDGNGFWGDPGEQIAAGLLLVPGPNALPIGVPPGAFVGPVFARFRFSSVPLPFDGAAPDGEVEDYEVLVEQRQNKIFGDSFEGVTVPN